MGVKKALVHYAASLGAVIRTALDASVVSPRLDRRVPLGTRAQRFLPPSVKEQLSTTIHRSFRKLRLLVASENVVINKQALARPSTLLGISPAKSRSETVSIFSPSFSKRQ